ncbi:Rhodanese-related sulfurtransferase [Rhizobiales bacterium GAS188]|nr:Rhodanese-related sulfurtransferase [Rhizobiales bacterium GAS188]
MSGHRDVSIDEVKQGLADNSILLVDVREPHEFAAAHIPGAVNVPLSNFDAGQIAPQPGQMVVFSCRSGVRSLKAIDASLAQGFDYDTHFPGSMLEWVGAGKAVETG